MQTSTVTSSLSAPQPPAPTVPSEPTSLPKVPESASCGKNARKVERTRSGLRIQEKWFSLERAFRCGKCGKSFSLRPVLVRHMKTMHSSCELKTLQGPEDTGSVE
ncbi:hypothetical protein BaRGS_00019435 [Batillaria attramentaria]|uniref:C2H2-type domain-containing protein n=1 Tax=Batillaria attramentaria TaxID=370345 RepID=A0ABD0KR24_9CAEN